MRGGLTIWTHCLHAGQVVASWRCSVVMVAPQCVAKYFGGFPDTSLHWMGIGDSLLLPFAILRDTPWAAPGQRRQPHQHDSPHAKPSLHCCFAAPEGHVTLHGPVDPQCTRQVPWHVTSQLPVEEHVTTL